MPSQAKTREQLVKNTSQKNKNNNHNNLHNQDNFEETSHFSNIQTNNSQKNRPHAHPKKSLLNDIEPSKTTDHDLEEREEIDSHSFREISYTTPNIEPVPICGIKTKNLNDSIKLSRKMNFTQKSDQVLSNRHHQNHGQHGSGSHGNLTGLPSTGFNACSSKLENNFYDNITDMTTCNIVGQEQGKKIQLNMCRANKTNMSHSDLNKHFNSHHHPRH